MMKFPLIFVLLVLVPGNILGKYVNFRDDLTYDDLVQTNVTCAYVQTCKEDVDSQYDRTCSCDSDCSKFGTCCIDSDYRDNSTSIVECRNVDSVDYVKTGYFLVSRCPPEVGRESAWKDLCEREWDGEDDIMMIAPVSSLDTFVSYKNYYCFRCHEDSDKFLSWDIRMESDYDEDRCFFQYKITGNLSITYDLYKETWTATTDDKYDLGYFYFYFVPPAGLPENPKVCDFVLVSECNDSWTDEDTREKCRSYTAIVYSRYNDSVSFKNPHCALCNFEDSTGINCVGYQPLGMPVGPKHVFSFSHLLNIHREDADKSGTKKCEENQLWDPYGRKCRKIACAIRGYVVKEGRCTGP